MNITWSRDVDEVLGTHRVSRSTSPIRTAHGTEAPTKYTNGLLRQYFPKGTDLSRWSAEDIDAVAHALNTRPRKTLGWKRSSMSTYDLNKKPVLRPLIEPSQYLSWEYRALCERHGITQSVGRIGSSQDNAVAESFWVTLKRELVSRCRFASRAEARRAIIAWINRYNAVRLHSSLGNVPPIEWELRFARRRPQAA
jgi:transposase InsO family protein